MLESVRSQGKRPMVLVANTCTTAVGYYDPLTEIAEFCRKNSIWLHVDGAHGASALVSEKNRHKMRGIEQADSLTWDAHKMLQTPVLCAALLVRDHRTLDKTFQQDASYLFHDKNRPGIDFAQRTVECTKSALGLKFYMVLAALGEKKLGEFIDRQYELAIQAYEYLNNLPEFECALPPQSNIVCFRIRGDDAMQMRIRDTMIAEGSFYISSTLFHGKRYLRLALMNPLTSMNDIERLARRIQDLEASYRDVCTKE